MDPSLGSLKRSRFKSPAKPREPRKPRSHSPGSRRRHTRVAPVSHRGRGLHVGLNRALAGRLLKVIHHVAAPDQTCGVPHRFIGENVALLRDLVHYANDADLPIAILPLDQEKVFVCVDWPFRLSTLSKMGFGPSFIRWVNLFYSDIRSSVIINGYTSRYFKPYRGVRQACPLSPLPYVLTMEVLAVNIRAHSAIRGLVLPRSLEPLPVLSL